MKRNILLIMVLSMFSGITQASGEEEFWKWFKANDQRLFHFERNQEQIFDELNDQLSKVNPDLTFEFGPILENGTREFVISAGGIKSSFPAVESLFRKAPKLDHWRLTKFRPRRSTLSDIEYGGVKVKAKDVGFTPLPRTVELRLNHSL